jgi:hypothetical protein
VSQAPIVAHASQLLQSTGVSLQRAVLIMAVLLGVILLANLFSDETYWFR